MGKIGMKKVIVCQFTEGELQIISTMFEELVTECMNTINVTSSNWIPQYSQVY